VAKVMQDSSLLKKKNLRSLAIRQLNQLLDKPILFKNLGLELKEY